jgi:hypothetical protein
LGERRPRVLRGMLPYGVRTFLWRRISPRQRSSAIARKLPHSGAAEKDSSHKDLVRYFSKTAALRQQDRDQFPILSNFVPPIP